MEPRIWWVHSAMCRPTTERIAMNHRILAGVALLCFVGVVAWGWGEWFKEPPSTPTPLPPTTTATVTATPSPVPLADLKGLGCGTKTGMLDNPQVKDILKNKYGIGNVDCPGD